ncbi:MAG: amino acid adenylation domain-containing protein [Syntrophomonadaceae bacterium]
MTDILNILNSLPPEKKALFLKKLQENGSKYNIFPLSYAQQRLWFLDQYEPGSPYYNIPSAMRIKGKFSIPVFKNVIEEIVRRHESLRTNFSAVEGKPVQAISQNVNVPFSVVDLKSLSEEEKDAEVIRLLTGKARCSFNLSSEPLIRITVLELDQMDHVVIVVMHHIISDGWSMGVLVQEISALYNAFSQGKPSPLAKLPVQYADYSMWQKEFMQGERLERQLSYWKGKLEGSSQYLNLPTDRPRPAVWTNNGSTLSRTIPLKTLEGLTELSRLERVTLFMTTLAAFQVLLHKYSGQHDISIGTPIANRTRKELEGLIGLFINTIVIRTGISGRDTFREYLRKVRVITLEGYENQDLPFEFLVEKLQPGRDMSYRPLFQVMFILQNHPSNLQPFNGLDISMIDVDMGTSTFDITLTAAETDDGLNASIEFNTDLFDRTTISRMLGHYENLLNNILLNPDARICDLQLMDDAERKMIIHEWNSAKTEFETSSCIHQIFERQAKLHPDNIAAVFEGSSLSYKELNEKANQLAHFLRKLGVGPEDIAGICIERSLEMLISLLGIIKAGGAYLPLDASYPEERLKFMLEDAGAKVLITQSHLRSLLPSFNGPVVLIDSQSAEISLESKENPANVTHGNNLVYVIYTSGSTGKPKGSMIQHESLFNYYRIIGNMYSRYFAAEPVRVALNTTIMFDASLQQIIFMLYGNTLYIPPEDVRRDGLALTEYIAQNKIDILDCVPSLLKVFLSGGLFSRSSWKPSLVLAGGEALDEATWKELLITESCDFFNTYGPTETTVDAAIGRVKEYPEKPTIGKPPLNVEIYILDSDLNLVPIGTPGELCIGGLSVGRGYLKRPELTAGKFIPDAYSGRMGARLYRTGDLARYNENGTIEFLGRIDSQIKLRGLRIELGEIENAIAEYDNVKESVVIAREDTPGDKRIVAYIVTHDGTSILGPQLKHFLSERLPEFMIPSAFVTLPKLPVTPNGKVDRLALPAPDLKEIMKDIESNYAAPRTAVEGVMSAIWSDILKIPKVGINDNFFELGGHSLLATQVISRIRTEFSLEIQLRCIFENPTVARLSQLVEKEVLKKNGLADKAIMPAARNNIIPLSFAQERLWFLDQLNPGNIAYNVPEAMRIFGKINAEMLEESLNIITRRHEILRTIFLSDEGKPYQKILPEFKAAVPVIEAGASPREEQEALINECISKESQKPFLLHSLPLFRALIIRLSEDESVLILTFHHIITDGWSSRKMFIELMKYYHQLSNGEHPALLGLPVQYADYAVWQREYFSGENLKKHTEYWTEKLKGSPQILELPTDRPRPALQSYNGSFLSFELPKELMDGVKKINSIYGVTLFMSLLSVFQVLLYKYTRQTDILIGTPIANRNRAEIEDLIGFFVNTLVIRVNISEHMKFSELIRQTKETALEAYTYQDLPFEMIVDALHLERSLSYSPLFQVMFFAENLQADSPFSNEGIDVQQIDIKTTSSKYDITLSAAEGNDCLRLAIEYNTDLFDKETIENLFCHYKRILEGIIKNPEQRIKEITPLSGEEEEKTLESLINASKLKDFTFDKRNKLSPLLLSQQSTEEVLRNWNRSAKEVPDGSVKLFHRLFELQAEKTPDMVAVVSEKESATYFEMNRKANMLARYLKKKGAGPDIVVGMLLGRNPYLVTSILAIMKSGAGYLPLDPVYPKDRIEYILKDAGVRLLISEEALKGELEGNEFEVIHIDRDWNEITTEEDDNLATEASPENIAYVIYTSGSTGKPKGSMIQYDSLYNYYRMTGGTFSEYFSSAPVRVALNTTIMFDGSLQPLMFLLHGNTLYLPPENIRRDGLSLTDYLLNNRIDILDGIPSLLKVFISGGLFNRTTWNPSLVIAGGEAMDETLWKELCSIEGTDFFNAYGPTECTVAASICRVEDYPEKPTIGKPPLDVAIYILDNDLCLLPIGAQGELCIGGLSVGRGYLNRPELTAEKFIPDPFSRRQGARLYRTGDLARYNLDGTIEFLGRMDSQVKLRGFRIELGEIEQVLMQHERVQDAVVMMRERNEGSRFLTAYITLKNAQDDIQTEIKTGIFREFLRRQLPDYMLPSSILILKEMPLYPNGKINRRALPDPAREREPHEEIIPKTDNEKILLEVWQKVLQLESVSLNDNFFEIGGDSILAIQVVAKARDKGLKIQPVHLFQHQTISQLALMISNTEDDNLNTEESLEGKWELIPVQKLFFELDLKQRNHWNQSVFFEINDKVELQELQKVIKTVMHHHEVLRSVFLRENGNWLMQIAPEAEEIPFYLIDLSAFDEKDLKTQIESRAFEVQSSLDIEKGPVIRFAYFKLNEKEKDKLLIAAHHLVIDVVSWRILLEDIMTSYNCLKEQKPLLLPGKTASYKKWSEYLVKYSSSEEIRKEAAFWLKLPFHKWVPLISDYPSGENLEKESSEVSLSLNSEDTLSLTRESQRTLNANMPEVLLTALARAYSAWSEKRVLLIDIEGHGREDQNENLDLSRTVGWFTSAYPLLLDLKTSIYPLDSLKVIKEQIRSIPGHGLGYGILKYLSDDKTIRQYLCSLPKSEISFNYLGHFNEFAQEENPLFSPAKYSKGPERGLLNSSRYLIDIICFVAEGQFQMQMRYSPNVFNEDTILRLSHLFTDELKLIIEYCKKGQAELSGSDFPLAHLSPGKFDKVLNRLNTKNIKGLK